MCHYYLKVRMNVAQARPMQSPMLALLDELHYIFFVIALKDL